MSLIKNRLPPAPSTNASAGFAGLSAVALLVLIPTWLYAGEQWRLGLGVLCGLLAGISAALAWNCRPNPENITEAIANPGATEPFSWPDLVAAIPDPTIVLNRSSVVLKYNAAALAIFERLTQGRPLEHISR
ncbi:MAG: two-component sensor histidine kinase, partial [Hyphomicrobium denitrificans]|nr:two-component sensor histidine kinase [Hyphomicrobium denitrificans]